jgi:hypothetical protein
MVSAKWIIVGIVAAVILGILLAVFWDLIIGTIGAVVIIAVFLLGRVNTKAQSIYD